LDTSLSSAAAEVAVRATNSGTFLVVASDATSGLGSTGNYRLSLAKTGSPLVISPSDEGGDMVNGSTYVAAIDTGDIDGWTFTATAGESFVVRMGETIAGSALTPFLRLYGPDGAFLAQSFSAAAAEVTMRATNSGTFLVVAGDGTAGLGGTGNYRISLAKTDSPLVISPADEGGPMTGSGSYAGTIDIGDIDAWSFTACAGDVISVNVTKLVSGSTLTPWVRLFGNQGQLLKNLVGSPVQFTITAPASGTYTLLISDGTPGIGGTGTYQLAVNGLTDGLKLCLPAISGTNAIITGIGGVPSSGYILLTTTNVTTPLASWTPFPTNQFDTFGVFNSTNFLNLTEPQRFFRIKLP
jgi:hypothetical protein